ncbi:MarR family winged helix-turn-helix transcriptional regulator [Anaerosacchariphilus polymeriproducens]|uniref:MarR family transcriptional regulator n=1 Tax=Anaerosacchariphilus polymeriproducens TaxID=1812858 RepID=A0A371ASU2_9FIRM|nr:MarR family winged helix-turn-helix transcriptional regulator [Anaerosacchariphilus polymeriproducens]RDU22530.1 MarR family transcriptional regulator [Anaerosacchariphilus polymeriproducens]
MEKNQKILDAITNFMPNYYVYINTALHKCEYNGERLHENQIKVMMTISLFEKISPTELSNGLNIQKGSLTTIIKSLVDMGFIEKNMSQKDERKYYLTLTVKGEQFVEFKNKDNQMKFKKLFEDISEEECEKIVEGFITLNNYLDKKGRGDQHG